MIHSYSIHTTLPWPHILFMGAIHGDEPCGAQALWQLTHKLQSEQHTIQKGILTIIPIANPLAYKQQKLCIDVNLNRCFEKHSSPQHYEHHLANILTDYIDRCDILVDLHSTTAAGAVNVFQDYINPSNTQLAQATGQQRVIQWRPECYDSQPEPNTLSYAHSCNKTAVLVECWQHQDPQSIKHAYQTAINVLTHYRMLERAIHPYPAQTVIRMTHIYKKIDHEDHVLQEYKHLDHLQRWTPLAIIQKKIVTMPYDGYIIMPKHNATIGQELLSLGQ